MAYVSVDAVPGPLIDRTMNRTINRTIKSAIESPTLAQIRDLLPKLTSGEIRIKDAARLAESVGRVRRAAPTLRFVLRRGAP